MSKWPACKSDVHFMRRGEGALSLTLELRARGTRGRNEGIGNDIIAKIAATMTFPKEVKEDVYCRARLNFAPQMPALVCDLLLREPAQQSREGT